MKALLVVVLLALTTTLSHAQSTLKWVRTNHPTMTSALSFSPDGKYLASAAFSWAFASDETSEIILWDGHTGKFIERQQIGFLRYVGGAEFLSPTMLLLGGDSAIYFYEVQSRTIEGVLGGYETVGIKSIDKSIQGDTLLWLASKGGYQQIYFYDRARTRIFDSIEVGYQSELSTYQDYFISQDLRILVVRDRNSDFILHVRNGDTTLTTAIDFRRTPIILDRSGNWLLLNNIVTNKQDSLFIPTMHLVEGVHEGQRAEQPAVQAIPMTGSYMAFADNRSMITPEYGVLDGYIILANNTDTINITGLTGEIALSPVENVIRAGGQHGMATYNHLGELVRLDKKPSMGTGYRGLSYSYAGEFSYIELGDISNDFTHRINVGSKSYLHYMAGMGFYCFNTPKIDPAANRFALGLEVFELEAKQAWMRCPVVTSEWTPTGSHYIYSTFSDTLVYRDRSNLEVPVITGHRKITSIAVSLTQDLIATAGVDSTIKLWTLDGQLVKTFVGHTGQVNDVNFAPNGRQLVSASSDSTIRVWDIDKGEIYKYTQFKEPFYQAAVSNDGLTVIAASDRSVVGFSAQDWARVTRIVSPNWSSIQAYSSNGRVIIDHNFSLERPVQLEVSDLLGRLLHRAEYTSNRITFDPTPFGNSPLIFTVSRDGKSASAIVPGWNSR